MKTDATKGAKMVQKHIVITKKTIENLNEDNYFDVIEPV
ncbi:hypothetical protein HMPREF1139_1109 [Campylobacter sp. FOBRC14]|nr:hypothetical protein HMPREF1139_1109 [Campylobacter sp. FOBRC14]